jgi:DNA segregation ATPase FtsK/SpoIIIE, S-DNA-T family
MRWPSPADRAPRLFPSLPTHINVSQLKRPENATLQWIPLGLGGPDLETIGIDLFDGPSSLLISGPSGSGRSTAAASVTSSLSAIGIGCVVLCGPRSPLPPIVAGLPNVHVLVGPTLTDDTIREALGALGRAQSAIIVDDCEQLTVSDNGPFGDKPTVLQEAVSPERRGCMALVLCGNASLLFDGPIRSLTRLTRSVRDEGVSVTLNPPTPNFAREHNLRLEADQFLNGPGRGYFTSLSSSLFLQMANRILPEKILEKSSSEE